MKANIILIIGLLFSCNSYSQTFVYTFEGKLDPFSITNLESKCSEIDNVYRSKIKYKEESNKGELYITIDKSEKILKGEEQNDFSPKALKAFLISNNLSPLSFRKLQD